MEFPKVSKLCLALVAFILLCPGMSWGDWSVLLFDDFDDGDYDGWTETDLMGHADARSPEVVTSPEGYSVRGTGSGYHPDWTCTITHPINLENNVEVCMEMRVKSGPEWPNEATVVLLDGQDFYRARYYGESNRTLDWIRIKDGQEDVFRYSIGDMAHEWHTIALQRDSGGWWSMSIDGATVASNFRQDSLITSFDNVELALHRNQSEIEWVRISVPEPEVKSPFEWTRIADLPGGQDNACAAVIDAKVYVVGGQNPSGLPEYPRYSNKMTIYDPATDSWSDGPSMSTRRYSPGAGVIEANGRKELYVVGGYSGFAGLSKVERYTPSTGTWETVASVTNLRGHAIMTAVVNNNLYAMGGFYNGPTHYATNEMYDRQNNVWVHKAPLPRPVQAGLETVWEDKIYIFGGSNAGGPLTNTLIYDTLSDTWSEGTEVPRSRFYVRAVTFGDYIYLIGGAGDSKIIDVYDPANDSWATIGDYPGSNTSSPVIAQSSNLVYVLGDSYSLPGATECWIGRISEPPIIDHVYHVDAVNGDDNNNGLTPQTAFATIQKGIDSVEDDYAVLVYPGVYTEEIVFKGKAITVQSAADAAVLEAPGDDAVSFYYGEEPNSVLKNFVIRNSNRAIFIAGSSPTISNVTVVDNEYGIEAYAGSEPDISNCIFWNNTESDLFQCQARYSCIQEGSAGEGNIDADPCFADANNGDYHLLSERGRYVSVYGLWDFDDVTSPCVDGGDPTGDYLNERRPNGGRINMGAYGGTAYASMSECWTKADINCDGKVDMLDFALMAAHWLEDNNPY